MNKRNSILMPSLQLIVDKNQRRSSFNGLSRNDIIQNLISISTKESSNLSQNQKPFGEDKNNGGLLNSKLFSALCKDTQPESVNPYKIFITPAQDFRDSLDYKYSRTPLRRMNLKLYPQTLTIKRISTKAHIRLEKERLASKPKMDNLKLPASESIYLPDI